MTNGTPASAPGRALGYNTSTWERPPLIHRGSELSPGSLLWRNHLLKQYFPSFSRTEARFKFVPSSLSRHAAPTELPPSSATRQSPWSRVPQFSLAPSCCTPQPAIWADLVRADPPEAQDGHPLEMLKRIEGRNRIEDAAPARKIEGQHTTPGPAPVEQDFAGEEPEAADEDLAGGESRPSAESPGRPSGAGRNTWDRASGKN